MLHLFIQFLCINTVAIAQRTFLPGPGIGGRFGGFGPLGGGPGFFGGSPFGGPGFDFGPGPGAGGFIPDFPAIGGPPMPFTAPRGPPDFDRIRRENGGFPVWGGAGINREDGTRAFDGWDGDPARLGVGSFSSQVGPSHILASQLSSSDDNSRDLSTVVQTTRVVVRPSPFRIPPRPRVTNQRETREQYARSIAQIRRNTLTSHGNANQRQMQTQRRPSASQRTHSVLQRTPIVSQRNPLSQRNPSIPHRNPPAPQRNPSFSHRTQSVSQTNNENRRVHQNVRNHQITRGQSTLQSNTRLIDTGQSGEVHLGTRRSQNAQMTSQTLPRQNSRTHIASGNIRRTRHREPLVYHRRFIADRSNDENDPNQHNSPVNQDNWIPGPIPGLEMISNQRLNVGSLQASDRITQNQNTGHPTPNINSIIHNPSTNPQTLTGPSLDNGVSLNQPTDQNQQILTLPSLDLLRDHVLRNHREPGPLTIIIDPSSIINQNTLPGKTLPHQEKPLPTVNNQQVQPNPPNHQITHDNSSPSSSSQRSNSGKQNVPSQPSMAGGATGGIGGVFGPTGPSTGGTGGRFADPTTGERIQVVPSDMANAVRQARVGGDPRAGGFVQGAAGQGVGPQAAGTPNNGFPVFLSPVQPPHPFLAPSYYLTNVYDYQPIGRFISGRTFTPGPIGPGAGVGGPVGGPVGQFGGRGDFTPGPVTLGPGAGVGGPIGGPVGQFGGRGDFTPGPVTVGPGAGVGGPVGGPVGQFGGRGDFTQGPVTAGPSAGVGGPVGQFGGRGDITRDRFMGPGPVGTSRTAAGLLSGPGGPIRIRIPADGGRPIVTRDGVSQPLPPGMSLADLGISSPPPVGPVRGPGPGPITSNINNGFTQNGGFSNGTLPRRVVVGETSMTNSSRLSRFQSGYGMFGRGRVYKNLLSSLGNNFMQILLPAHRRVNNANNNVISVNDRTIVLNEPSNNVNSNVKTVMPITIQSTPVTKQTTTTPLPTTSTPKQGTTTTPDIPEEIEPVPGQPSSHENPTHAGDMGYTHLSKFQRTVAEMLGLPASHTLIRNLSMIETMAQRNGFEIELEGGMPPGEPMQPPSENNHIAETTTVGVNSPIISPSTLPPESIQAVAKTISSPLNDIIPSNNIIQSNKIIPPDIPSNSRGNTNIENNLTQDGFLKTLNSLLLTGKREVQVNFDTNTGIYKLSTRPVAQGTEWHSAHAPRREHPAATHTLKGFVPPPVDPGLISQPTGGQTIVSGVSGAGPADIGHSHGSGLGEVHNANTNNVEIGANNNGAPDLLVIQMADLRNRDNLPAIMNALENIANAQGGAAVAGQMGINDRNNALGTRI